MEFNCSPFIFWLFGIPGSGKSTVAKKIAQKLTCPIEILDSDDIRERVTPKSTWSDEERVMLYNSMVEISLRLFNHNISSIIAASAGGVDMDYYRKVFPPRTYYIYLDCELANASKRHPAGLYSAAKGTKMRLPIIRSTKNGKVNKNDIEYTKTNNLNSYNLVIPEHVDLIINTNNLTDIESNIMNIITLII